MVERLVRPARELWCSLPTLRREVLIYVASAGFAAGVLLWAGGADYRRWGAMAAVAYGAGALACEAAHRLLARGFGSRFAAREAAAARVAHAMVVALFLAALVLPLSVQVVRRAEGRPGPNAQPEVAVIERAGARALHHEDPYLAHPATVGVSPSSDAASVDRRSFFPYLPGMVAFGLVSAISRPPELGDARLAFSVFTLLVALVALGLVAAPSRRRWRVFQVLMVLPTGALVLTTGGDDLPVLALMLLGLLLAARRRPVLAGLALGLAGSLKFTAWPLLLLLMLGVSDREGRRAPFRYGAAAAVVVLPVLGLGAALDLRSFVLNVVRFPLGLAHVRSPAASPLPGEVLVHLLPGERGPLTALLVLVGAVAVVLGLWWYRPSTPAAVATATGLALALAICLAPATRFGYLIYTVNLLVWVPLLEETGAAAERRREPGPPPAGERVLAATTRP